MGTLDHAETRVYRDSRVLDAANGTEEASDLRNPAKLISSAPEPPSDRVPIHAFHQITGDIPLRHIPEICRSVVGPLCTSCN